MNLSLVFVRSVPTEDHVLVSVYAEGHRAGTLAFSNDVWAEIERRGGVEIFLAEKYDEEAK